MEGSRLLTLCMLQVILLLYITQLQPVSAKGSLSITFRRYINPEGKGKNGHCCDGRWSFCSSECDHYFVICLDTINSPNTTSPCKYNKTQSIPVKNANTINFKNVSQADIGFKNPIILPLNPLVMDVAIKVAVYDKDSTGSDDDVDFLRVDLGLRPHDYTVGASHVFNVTHRTTLELEVQFRCDRDWYGSTCGTFCDPPNIRDKEHYTCNKRTGHKDCDRGWEGPLCSSMSSQCRSDSCQNWGTCSWVREQIRCQCSSEFTGETCQIDACDKACLANQNHGVCRRTAPGQDGYRCDCNAGYQEVRPPGDRARCQWKVPTNENRPNPNPWPRPDDNRPRPDDNRPRPDDNRPRPDDNRPRPDDNRPRPDDSRPRPGDSRPRPGDSRPRPGDSRPRPTPRPSTSDRRPDRPTEHHSNELIDCDVIKKQSYKYSDGVYRIKIGIAQPFMVYCDMTSTGGYTVLMYRGQGRGSTSFFRNWLDYKEGFGEPGKNTDHWLGLEHMYRLTSQRSYKLRIDMKIASGRTYFAEYDLFEVGSEYSKYQLKIGGYHGTAGDALGLSDYDPSASHNNQQFSTYEEDNDGWSVGNCASDFKSGWWFNSCYAANLNGIWMSPGSRSYPKKCTDESCIQWRTIPDHMDSPLQEVSMKIIPKY